MRIKIFREFFFFQASFFSSTPRFHPVFTLLTNYGKSGHEYSTIHQICISNKTLGCIYNNFIVTDNDKAVLKFGYLNLYFTETRMTNMKSSISNISFANTVLKKKQEYNDVHNENSLKFDKIEKNKYRIRTMSHYSNESENIKKKAVVNIDNRGNMNNGDANSDNIPNLTWKQWKQVFICAAVPMIGFGVIDQLIMIRAGDIINNTIGVTLCLPILVAAAIGQLCSDTSGVLFGSAIGSLVQILGLSLPDLTKEQGLLSSYRLATMLGSVFGVSFGCLLGMIQLLFIDVDKPERLKRQMQLDTIFEMVMSDGPRLFHCERGTLFVYDKSKQEIWSKAVFGLEQAIRIRRDKTKSFTTWVLDNKEILNCKDAYNDPRFNPIYDQKYKYKTRSVLAAPIVDRHGEIIAVLMFINKHEAYGGRFTENDERMLEMMCMHVQIFMEKFDYGPADDKRMISLGEDKVCQGEELNTLSKSEMKREFKKVKKKRKNKFKEKISTSLEPCSILFADIIDSGDDFEDDIIIDLNVGENKNNISTASEIFNSSNKYEKNNAGSQEKHKIQNAYDPVLIISRCVDTESVTSLSFLHTLHFSDLYLAFIHLKKKVYREKELSLVYTNKKGYCEDCMHDHRCSNNNEDDTDMVPHNRPSYWNLKYPHLYDNQHPLTGKIVEINRGEDF